MLDSALEDGIGLPLGLHVGVSILIMLDSALEALHRDIIRDGAHPFQS